MSSTMRLGFEFFGLQYQHFPPKELDFDWGKNDSHHLLFRVIKLVGNYYAI